jgi:anti-sigma B factor antagonist
MNIPGMVARRVDPDIDVVELIGTLRIGSTLSWIETDLRRLISEGSRKLIIDVSRLRYADSAGIGLFITVNGAMEQAGGGMRISGANGEVAKSFNIVHIDRVIQMNANVDAACDSFASGNA